MRIFISVQYVVVKDQKSSKVEKIQNCLSKIWHIHIMVCHVATLHKKKAQHRMENIGLVENNKCVCMCVRILASVVVKDK